MTASFANNIDGLKASIYANASLGEEFMSEIGFDLNETLLSCVYNKIRCDASFFTPFTSFDQGNCWTFNSVNFNAMLTTGQPGKYYGLTVELFTGFNGKLNMIMSMIYHFMLLQKILTL